MTTEPDNNKDPQVDAARRLLSGSAFARKEALRGLGELAERSNESLRLYRPLPYQELFHKETTQQLLVQKGNRTGATLALMVEIARAVTGNDPYGKYPKEGGKAAILVYGENHVGRVVYNGLFKAGHFQGFRLIKDLATGRLRTYRPWPAAEKVKGESGDLERKDESIPHGPLIPKRYVLGRPAWVKRSERVFSVIRFTTGWELYAANSAGDPGQFQGLSINLYAIDEDLAMPGWYEEAVGRVTDVGGLIRWTALPHAKNDDMMELIDYAEKEKFKEKPGAKIIRASIFDNKFLDPEKRDSVVNSWRSMGEEVYRKRAHGELDILSSLMYPTFSRHVHDVMNSPTLDKDCELLSSGGKIPGDWTASRILAARMGEPPDNWTRYVSIDPGYTILAIAFLTVPPPELGDQVFLYDLCYLHQATASTFGEAMHEKYEGRVFEKFFMDFHGGKLRSIATGDVPIECYQDELKQRGIKSEATGDSFFPGEDDRKYREEVMRRYLAIERHGQPRFMYVGGKCQSFVSEMEKFRKKSVKQRGKDIYIDEGDRRAGTHAIEAVEQAIALELEYVKPRDKSVNNSWLDRAMSYSDRQQQRIDKGRALLGGGGNFISLGPMGART